jgi:hypothetical protein
MNLSEIIASQYIWGNASEMRRRYVASFYHSFGNINWDNLSELQEKVWERETRAIEEIENLPINLRSIAENLVNDHKIWHDNGWACFEPSYALKQALLLPSPMRRVLRASEKSKSKFVFG